MKKYFYKSYHAKRRSANLHGFTVVELVIVIAVIGILSAILIPTFINMIDQANYAARQSEMTTAYKLYVAEVSRTGGTPISQDRVAMVKKGSVATNENTYSFQLVKEDPSWELIPATFIARNLVSSSSSEYRYDVYSQGREFEKGDQIEYGSYPQTIVSLTDSLHNALLALPGDSGNDIYYQNERYYKFTTNVFYGQGYTYSDGTSAPSGSHIRFFKYEPIKWSVLSGSDFKYKFVSDIALTARNFSSNLDDAYDVSTIRSWLNSDFLNHAFNAVEQQYISLTDVDNSAVTTGNSSNVHICPNTQDYVFLPSRVEAHQLVKRVPTITDFTIANKGRIVNTSRIMTFWTRSLNWSNRSSTVYILTSGSAGSTSKTTTTIGIRPVVTLDLEY